MTAASSGSHLSPFDKSFSVRRRNVSIWIQRQDCSDNGGSMTLAGFHRERTLVVQQLLSRLGRVLRVRALNNGVDGA